MSVETQCRTAKWHSANAKYCDGHWHNFEKRLLASSCLSVRPSFHVEPPGSSWTDHGILYTWERPTRCTLFSQVYSN